MGVSVCNVQLYELYGSFSFVSLYDLVSLPNQQFNGNLLHKLYSVMGPKLTKNHTQKQPRKCHMSCNVLCSQLSAAPDLVDRRLFANAPSHQIRTWLPRTHHLTNSMYLNRIFSGYLQQVAMTVSFFCVCDAKLWSDEGLVQPYSNLYNNSCSLKHLVKSCIEACAFTRGLRINASPIHSFLSFVVLVYYTTLLHSFPP